MPQKVITVVEDRHKFRKFHIPQFLEEVQAKFPYVSGIQIRELNGLIKEVVVDHSSDVDDQVILDILARHRPKEAKTLRELMLLANDKNEEFEILKSVMLDLHGSIEVKS